MTSENSITPIIENRLYFLSKRGEYEHIKALYEEGEVYINSIDYIRNCDNNEDRSDKEDGIFFREFIGDAKITICDINKDLDKYGITFNSKDVVFNNDHETKGNIYCLTGIYSEHISGERKDITFDVTSLGKSIILIHNPQEFLNRLFKALKENGYLNFKSSKVIYYNNDYTGHVGFFKKHDRFKPQNEYRIFVQNSKNEPIKIKIGSLKDIASFNSGFLQLKYEDGIEQIITL